MTTATKTREAPCAHCGRLVVLAEARWLLAGPYCEPCFGSRMAEVHEAVRVAREGYWLARAS